MGKCTAWFFLWDVNFSKRGGVHFVSSVGTAGTRWVHCINFSFSNILSTAHNNRVSCIKKSTFPICFCTRQHSEPLGERRSLRQWNKWAAPKQFFCCFLQWMFPRELRSVHIWTTSRGERTTVILFLIHSTNTHKLQWRGTTTTTKKELHFFAQTELHWSGTRNCNTPCRAHPLSLQRSANDSVANHTESGR